LQQILVIVSISTPFKPFVIIILIMKALIAAAYKLQVLNGSFTGPNLSKEAGISYGHAASSLKIMLNQGLVERTSPMKILGSGGRSNLAGNSPATYKLKPKARSMVKVILSGGVFDIIHPGHVFFLEKARSLGDVLVAVVARDSLITKRKPVNNEAERLMVVSSLKPVDAAIPGSSRGHGVILEKIKPDVVALGYDQDTDFRWLKKHAPGLMIERIPKVSPASTTRIIEKIKGSLD
jgi:FAD synthetase